MKKLLLKNIIVVCFILFTTLTVFSQTVSGTVLDPNNDPVIGASVMVSGTTIGTVTDIDGTFELNDVGNGASVEISYLGYRTQSFVTDQDNSVFNIILAEDVNQLDEVVITGLGSGVKRSNSGNAVASVSAEQLTGNTAPQTLDGALFGKVAGVQMSSNSGAPGGGISMQLRGVSTLGAGSSQPLFIIDGVYVNNKTIRTGRTQVNGASGGQNAATQDDAANRISDINPEDIAKIEILKGPSAAAIYGTRANAGVVIITTKRGEAGETKVSLSQDIGVANGQNFQNFGIWDSARTATYSGDDPDELAAQSAAESQGRNTDWEDFFYGETGLLSNTQLSISGGNQKTQFRISGGLTDESGIIQRTGFQRYSARANVDHRLNDRIKVGLSSGYYRTNSDRGFTGNQNNTGGSIGYALAYTPSYADLLPDENGNYPNNSYFNDNPIAIRDLGENNQKVDRFITAGNVDFTLFSDESSFLRFSVTGGVDYTSGNSFVYFPEILQHQAASANPGDVMRGRDDQFNSNLQGLLIYNKDFAGFNSSTTAGVVRLDQNSEFVLNRGRGLAGGQTNIQWATVQSIQDQAATQVTDLGYVIQEDLNFDDKIAVSLGMRFDKSTLNANQSKFYAFPKASVALNLHNFDFWKGDGFIDNLKLRAAYGQTGGLPRFGVTYESLTPQLIGGSLGAQVGSRAIDPNLEPETASEIEFGIDAGFLDGRILLEATYYNKTVNDLIFDIEPPESTGITAIGTNAGDLRNTGIELALGVNSIRTSKLNMYSRLTYWKNDSELTRWTNPQTTGGFGPSLGTYLFAEGFSPTTIVGTPSGTDNPLGFTVYGDRQPDFNFSFSNELNISKNLDFNFLFHWQSGGSAINLSALLWDIGGTTPGWDDIVTQEDGTETTRGNARLGDWGGGNTGAYIEETSYVKLREMGLYYTIPGATLNDFVKRIKIGASLNNFLLWTSYGSYDPEVSNFGTQSIAGNIEVTPYPSSRRIFFHVKLDF
jgi:TonB-linked SusC/RagA family outer membrane protein